MKLMWLGDAVTDMDMAALRMSDRRTLFRAVTRSGALVQRQAKLNTQTVFAQPSQHLGKTIMVHSNESALSADIGPHHIAGRIQELGGTVRPVHAKALAIPIGTLKGNASTHQGLHIQRINGTAYLVDEQGVLQYRLQKVAVIKPHPYLSPALAAQEENIAAEFDSAIRQVFGVS